MRHWYHVARHNENVMPLCIYVIHHIVLTFKSYLMNHQKKIKKFTPSQLIFGEFVWGRSCGKHPPSKPGDHFMLGRKCTVVNAFPCIIAEGQMHLHKVSLHKLAYETISCFLQGTFCSKLTRKLCLVKCLENTLRIFAKVIMEVTGFHALLKNWKNLTLIIRCNILIFNKRHINEYKVPLESIFFSK